MTFDTLANPAYPSGTGTVWDPDRSRELYSGKYKQTLWREGPVAYLPKRGTYPLYDVMIPTSSIVFNDMALYCAFVICLCRLSNRELYCRRERATAHP